MAEEARVLSERERSKPYARVAPRAPVQGEASTSTAAGWLANFPPGSFAFVMATGIVSITTHLAALPWVPNLLFALNAVAYPALWVLMLTRILRFPRATLKDLTSHSVAPTFLTMVAATAVLGMQFVLLTERVEVGLFLWVLAALLWLSLIYGFFLSMTVADPAVPLEQGLNGAWLLATVSTESLSILGTAIADLLPNPEIVTFACLCLFLLGGMFYLAFITLILHRWLFHRMAPVALTPPYWINMGAVAITTLAGAELMARAHRLEDASAFPQIISMLTTGVWAVATWWIPLLVGLSLWRHAVRREPLRYDTQYWSIVFPLGMYSAATFVYAHAAGYGFLMPIAQVFVWVALAAWAATFCGLLRKTIRLAGFRPQ